MKRAVLTTSLGASCLIILPAVNSYDPKRRQNDISTKTTDYISSFIFSHNLAISSSSVCIAIIGKVKKKTN